MSSLRPSSVRSAKTAAAVGTVAAMVCVAASANLFGEWSGTAFVLVGFTAMVSVLTGIRRLPRFARLPWVLIAASVLLFLVGAALRDELHTVGDLSSGRSFLPDLVSVPGYLFLALGLVGMVRIRRRGTDGGLDALLDGCLAGMAALALAWVFLMEPAMAHVHASTGVRLSVVAYTPLSLMMVVLASQVAFAAGSRRGASLIGAVVSMTFLLIGDVLFTLVDARVADLPQFVTSLPYGLAFAGISYLALHPTFTEWAETLPVDKTVASPARLAFVALALAIPAVVSVSRTQMATSDRAVLATVVVLLTVTATFRMVRALQHHARSERRLMYQATHDTLTHAWNRAGVLEGMAQLERDGIPYAVLLADLDRFKLANDTFGHGFGDELLIETLGRICRAARPDELVARVGGDEFVVVVDASSGPESVVARAELLRVQFDEPFEVRGTEIPMSVSVGIAMSRQGATPEDLLRDADTAMYGAKDAGRDWVMVFDDSMRDKASSRLAIERDLRHALERRELAVHYQPVVRMPDGQVKGFEALMRWNHPTRGTVPPLAFIPVAEETGLIGPIGAWILDEACRQLVTWRRTLPGASHLTVSVNVSARQLRDPDFLFMVDRTLDRHGLDPDVLHLELTESMLLENPTQAAAILSRIRERGIHLSIDDFGTGYSSLAYLKRFPFDCVKVDKAFVDPLDGDEPDHQLVAAIVAMAEALGLSTIAEGVESLAQAEQLVALGCETAQGFYYSRPLPAEAVPAALARLGVVQPAPSVAA